MIAIGEKLSDEMRERIIQSFGVNSKNVEFTKIAANLEVSIETVKSLVYQRSNVTEKTYPVVIAILKSAFDVNKMHIVRAKKDNRFFTPILKNHETEAA